MPDEAKIEALSCAYDREMSAYGPFGGMYDFTDYRFDQPIREREETDD